MAFAPRFLAACALAAAGLTPSIPWAQAARSPVAVASVLLESASADPASLPKRAMANTGRHGRFNAQALYAGRMRLDLPDGRTVTATRKHEVRGARADHGWIGEFEGHPGSLLSITLHRGYASGFAHIGNETWELQATGPGRSRLFRVDTDRLPQEGPLPYAAPDVTGNTTLSGTTAVAADPVLQDLMIVYTAAAATGFGGVTALESAAINAVNAANSAYANSQIGIQLNLVSLRPITYTETGDMNTSLSQLRSTTDGIMDEVHGWRDTAGADMVVLLTNDTSCGLAYVGSATGSASSAFSIVAPDCMSNHTLAHEIGHNQGNRHDRTNTSGTGAYPYSYGYRTCDFPTLAAGQNFRTVMGYSCTSPTGGSVPRVNYFSNPQVMYNGVAPMGIAYETDPTNSADNARSMNNTAGVISAYRAQATPLPSAPSALGAAVLGYDSIRLTWTDNASNESGFVVQRSVAGGSFADIATLASNTTSFDNTGLSANTSYSYRVRAYNSGGNSSYSNTVTALTPTVPAPLAPSSASTALNLSNKTATVSWSNVSNETGFEVVRELFNTRKASWGTPTSASTGVDITSLSQLLTAGQYRYKVRALGAGGNSAYVNAPCSTPGSAGCQSDGSIVVPKR